MLPRKADDERKKMMNSKDTKDKKMKKTTASRAYHRKLVARSAAKRLRSCSAIEGPGRRRDCRLQERSLHGMPAQPSPVENKL